MSKLPYAQRDRQKNEWEKKKEYNEYVELSFEAKKLILIDKLPQALEKMEEYYREKDTESHKSILRMKLNILITLS